MEHSQNFTWLSCILLYKRIKSFNVYFYKQMLRKKIKSCTCHKKIVDAFQHKKNRVSSLKWESVLLEEFLIPNYPTFGISIWSCKIFGRYFTSFGILFASCIFALIKVGPKNILQTQFFMQLYGSMSYVSDNKAPSLFGRITTKIQYIMGDTESNYMCKQ